MSTNPEEPKKLPSQAALCDEILRDDSISIDVRGAIVAARKSGAFADDISDMLRRYGSHLDSMEAAKGRAKHHKEEADRLLESIRDTRKKNDDLGDLVTLAETEAQFIRAGNELFVKTPRSHALAFNENIGEPGEWEADEIGVALQFAQVWDALGHFKPSRKSRLEKMQKDKAEANRLSRSYATKAKVEDGTTLTATVIHNGVESAPMTLEAAAETLVQNIVGG